MMDHGREGPPGLIGGEAGAPNVIEVTQDGHTVRPPHLSKGENYELRPGDTVQVRTPGGGGYGPARERAPDRIDRDIRRGYYRETERARQAGLAAE